MNVWLKRFLIGVAVILVAGLSLAPNRRWRSRWDSSGNMISTEGGDWVDQTKVRTAREIASHSTGTPEWTNPAGFGKDVFTFVRIIRDRDPEASPSSGNWITDFPDSDLNLSFRLQQVTSMRTSPDGRTIRLTDPDLL